MADRRLLIPFVKFPHPGRVKTRLAATYGDTTAAHLYRAFLLDALYAYARLDDVDLLVAVADPFDLDELSTLIDVMNVLPDWSSELFIVQQGNDLGERLEAAMEEGFARGYDAVCLIGTDHPTLPLDYIRRGFAELTTHRVVLGPTKDGGYYLVGASEQTPPLFREMPWSTPRLFDETVERIRANDLSLSVLPGWYDIDTADDVERLLDECEHYPLPRFTAAALVDARLLSEEMTSRSDPDGGEDA